MVMPQTHETYIRQTFELALKARGMVAPNPLVGCVVVKDGQVIARGFHQGPGQAHAEVDALKDLSAADIGGATLYCNLEPCCHTNKRTPPCTSLLLQKRPAKVVISNLDPNPEVAGKGVAILREAGIEVITGVLEAEGAKLNEIFFKNITTGLPFIHLKVAQTLDGKICSSTGSSQWITDEKARALVHQWRNDYDAVMVGARTANYDDPSLTPRSALIKNKASPRRLILRGSAELPANLKLFSDEFRDYTEVVEGSDLNSIFEKQAAKGITSILIEAGPKLASSLLNSGLVDRLSVFIAPKILGNGRSFYHNEARTLMSEAVVLKDVENTIIGDQVLMSGRL